MSSYGYTKKRGPVDRIADLNYNPFYDSDSYKASHWLFYPPGMTYMHSYFESRGGEYQNNLFFGLQYALNKYIAKPITQADYDEFMTFMKIHGPTVNTEGMKRVLERGFWPVRIRAVKEGALVPVSNCLLTVESTDSQVPWVANYLEGMIQRACWAPTTVATKSWHARKIGEEFYLLTTGSTEGLSFMLQDFGSRGVSTYEGSESLGGAHLINFQGTDTMAAVRWLQHYYPDDRINCAGYSVNATEHSNMTSWGGPLHEMDAIRNAVEHAPAGSILSVVTDSYDQTDTIANKIPSLLNRIRERDLSFVCRLDSGDPKQTVIGALEILAERIGFTTTMKGYKQLSHKFKVLQGDGMKVADIRTLLKIGSDHGFAATNYVFGMGGGLLQDMTRDTGRFAVKCSSITRDGKEIDVFKDPATDRSKRSKAGRLDLEIQNGRYKTVRYPAAFGSALDVVYEDGQIFRQQSLGEVRSLAWENGF